MHGLDTGQCATSAADTRRWISALSGQPATVSLIATPTLGPSMVTLADHAERHDAAMQLGVLDVAEGVHDRRASDRGRAHMNIRAHGSASATLTPQGPWPG